MDKEASSGILACKYYTKRIKLIFVYFRSCRGKGTVHQTVKETVSIPKGVDNGVNLRVSKKGHS